MSFFAKKPTRARDGHLLRGSSVIRGQQIADYLGAKYNPEQGYEDDVLIYVKPPNYMYDIIEPGPRNYVDILDSGYEEMNWLKDHPGVNVIAASSSARDYLISELGRTNVVLIPQHHCNYERLSKKQDDKFVAGYINTPREIAKFLPAITAACDYAGADLKVMSKYRNRQDVQDFYKDVDLQIIWRIQAFQAKPLKNALKMVNAGSFGIPTVAFDEPGYIEYKGHYIPVNSFEELREAIKKFKEDSDFYGQYADKNLKKAESYHIEHVSKLYLGLLGA